MFDRSILSEVLSIYKNVIASPQWWEEEKFKLIAIQCFQDHWDINADDFAQMLAESLAKTYELLASSHSFPRDLIVKFASVFPDEVRVMFIDLFDESKDIFERIDAFKTQSGIILQKYGNNEKNHFQTENSISTYLWLRYPDKYYIYKYGEVRNLSLVLGSEHIIKQGSYADNIKNSLALYDEVTEYIKQDAELVELYRSNLTDECYPDPELRTLTVDIGYFISKEYLNDLDEYNGTSSLLNAEEWFPTYEEYTPGISKEKWLEMLNDPDIIGPVWGGVLAEFFERGGGTTCSQIAAKYNKTAPSISGICTHLAKRIHKVSNCPLYTQENGQKRYWTILFQGKKAEPGVTGAFVWKLRPELYDALEEFDIMRYKWDSSDKKLINGISWYGLDYEPGLSIEDWIALFKDPAVFTTSSLEIMKRMKDHGGIASCTQLAEKYGETKNFYNSGSVALARRICKSTGISPNTDDKGVKEWFTVLYIGRGAMKGEAGSYIWKLRDNLSMALDKIDLSGINLYASANDDGHGFWWLNANPKIWSFSDLAIGDTEPYTLYNENGRKRRIFQNFLDVKTDDQIICYESNPVKKIVALGRIVAEQDENEILFKKTESLVSPIDYAFLKGCPELENMEFFQNPNGTLFKLTKDEYDFILDIIRDQNPSAADKSVEKYTKNDFLNEVYMEEARYKSVLAVLENKKNIILQGAPGVGKTFAAKRLAWSMIGEKEDSQIEFIQFHQNYSYEDFMMGYKPVDEGFELRYGIFYQFCQKVANQPDKEFFFIIDEINRGNMSKIFGELLMLIEKEYRGTKMTLAYNGMSFSVPSNLYIIGMMNTADRSLAMIDYALRRRFSFFDMEPGFDSKGFVDYQKSLNNKTLDSLISRIKELNVDITNDKSLGKGFCIGHSYFCGMKDCTEDMLRSIVDYDILPMIREYWFDNPNKVQHWENILQGVFQQ